MARNEIVVKETRVRNFETQIEFWNWNTSKQGIIIIKKPDEKIKNFIRQLKSNDHIFVTEKEGRTKTLYDPKRIKIINMSIHKGARVVSIEL